MRYGPDSIMDKDGRFRGFVRTGDEVVPGGGVVLTITAEALTCRCPRSKHQFKCAHTPVKQHNPRSVVVKV